MAVIAVAGGTGGVGKTLIERLAQEPKFQVVLLSRNESLEPTAHAVSHVRINYNDISAITHQLEHHNVHTVISAIGLVSEETSRSQLNLIEAADKSKVTERFIPSEYSFIQTAALLPIDPSIQWWLDAADRLKSSSLAYTRVIPGFFMDYWGMPHVPTNLAPHTFGISIASRTAAIPGDGNDVICMTYTYDLAAYMVKLLDLNKWPEFSVVVGDEVTYNQLLRMAEDITGKSLIHHHDQINAGNVTVPPMPDGTEGSPEELQEITALVSRLTVNGVFDLRREENLNTLFPEVKPITMKEFLEKAWTGHEL
ncbi:uncharacterized protein N7459_005958 [Penicillium hispanicum]|uniref:uncharacterized protein n=1 Tax=Penicillium hispanicum TaxID=1080232 RepID=UPI00253F986C|nr:uncharacterized protein N7459_005958 [Penicillium hispanicum]KAJ5579973.1 hypothetical protein N7459_005958 [Penicillium hispanicum]